MSTVNEEKLESLFETYVPARGKADTVTGEIVRAVERIIYRKWNDGDRIGVDYGNETCNSAARYLISICDDNVKKTINMMWGEYDDSFYDFCIEQLEEAVLKFLESHPECNEMKNDNDMLAYDAPEDYTYKDEDDEEDYE